MSIIKICQKLFIFQILYPLNSCKLSELRLEPVKSALDKLLHNPLPPSKLHKGAHNLFLNMLLFWGNYENIFVKMDILNNLKFFGFFSHYCNEIFLLCKKENIKVICADSIILIFAKKMAICLGFCCLTSFIPRLLVVLRPEQDLLVLR